MLKASINLTLNSVDEKAALKISKSVEKAAEKLTRKFARRLKAKSKLKNEVKGILESSNKTNLESQENSGA